MKIVCGPRGFEFPRHHGDLNVLLYARDPSGVYGTAGAAIVEGLHRRRLVPHQRAWDFLSIALAITAADRAGHRNRSEDGWTRAFDLNVSVADPDFWATQVKTLEALLRFLTTDLWRLTFNPGARYPGEPGNAAHPDHDSIALLSGGLDSFIGALDLVAQGRRPLAVSQTVRGDAEKQCSLVGVVGGGIGHLQLNHNATVPDAESPPSQRARSVIFFAYGVLAATTLRPYLDGGDVSLFVCENGFISLNPPLTALRLGSLSTRTSHPVVLALLQRCLDAAGLRIHLENPYAFKTKGEMLAGAVRQDDLIRHAHQTTSCGRFNHFGNRHCGRCLPCLIRRAAFGAWRVRDRTQYVYRDLSIDDREHARSDDVRAAGMAVAEVAELGLDEWLGVSLSSPLMAPERSRLRDVAARGLAEVGRFLRARRVR